MTLRVLDQSLGDGLVGVRAALRVPELALISVRALLSRGKKK